MAKRWSALVVPGLAGLLAVLLAAYGGAPAADSAQKVTVEASEFKFQPAAIEVVAGRKVQVTFHNKGTMEHDFTVEEMPLTGVKAQSAGTHSMEGARKDPALHVSAVNGRSATVEFTPTSAGTYEIHCTVAGHKEAGMSARLVVKAQ